MLITTTASGTSALKNQSVVTTIAPSQPTMTIFSIINSLIVPVSGKNEVWVMPPGVSFTEPDFTNQALKEILIYPFLKEISEKLPFVHQFIFSVICDFYRTTIDNRSPKFKSSKRINKDWKQWIDHEVVLMRSLWKMLEVLWARGYSSLHPIQALTRIVQEGELILVSVFHVQEHGKVASENLKRIQKGNRQLQTLNNPFCKGYTADLVDSILLLADRSDDFRKVEFNNFISARQGIAVLFKQQMYTGDPVTGKRIEQRGRRKSS